MKELDPFKRQAGDKALEFKSPPRSLNMLLSCLTVRGSFHDPWASTAALFRTLKSIGDDISEKDIQDGYQAFLHLTHTAPGGNPPDPPALPQRQE